MRLLDLAGRAEPDDLQGWMEQGGLLALQRVLALEPAALRDRLAFVRRRDGQGEHYLGPNGAAVVTVRLGPAPRRHHFIARELPAWLWLGALTFARAVECPVAWIALSLDDDPAIEALLREVAEGFERLGIAGPGGWAGGIRFELVDGPLPRDLQDRLDADTAVRLPFCLDGDDGSVLLAVAGDVARPGLYEGSLDAPLRALLAPAGLPAAPRLETRYDMLPAEALDLALTDRALYHVLLDGEVTVQMMQDA